MYVLELIDLLSRNKVSNLIPRVLWSPLLLQQNSSGSGDHNDPRNEGVKLVLIQ